MYKHDAKQIIRAEIQIFSDVFINPICYTDVTNRCCFIVEIDFNKNVGPGKIIGDVNFMYNVFRDRIVMENIYSLRGIIPKTLFI